jgi:CheY-like chemotaxis protein
MGGMNKLLNRIVGEDVELNFEHDGQRARIRADKGQFDQVILNLLVNARDAMPSGGAVRIHVRGKVPAAEVVGLSPASNGWVGIDVTDNGLGIPPDILARVFDPFFTTKEAGKGTGLGLATVYGIVHQSGGRITVASEVGKGTSFRILLPACDDDAQTSTERRVATPASGSGTLLLVEDQDTVRRLFRAVLEQAGYLVIEAESGEEAMELAGAYSGRIDVLVTDMLMPRMGGRELAEKLTKLRPSLRVLLVSGYTDDAFVKDGRVPRDWIFLHKPMVPADLVARVNDLITTRNAGIIE